VDGRAGQVVARDRGRRQVVGRAPGSRIAPHRGHGVSTADDAGDRGLVGLGQVDEHVAHRPCRARRRRGPPVVVEAGDEGVDLVQLVAQGRDDGVHQAER
jgi:hypothetical protein